MPKTKSYMNITNILTESFLGKMFVKLLPNDVVDKIVKNSSKKERKELKGLEKEYEASVNRMDAALAKINKSLEKKGITVPETDDEFKQMFKDINKLYGIKK